MKPTRRVFRAEKTPGNYWEVVAYSHGYDESIPILEGLTKEQAVYLAGALQAVILDYF